MCATPTLSAKDDQLNALYTPLKAQKIFRELETDWLKNVRNQCKTPECLESAYDRQIRRLTAVPAPAPVASDSLAPLPKGEVYAKVEDAPWQRFALAPFIGMSEDSVAQLIDVTVKDDVLPAFVYVSGDPDGPTYVQDTHVMRATSGTLLEYADDHPGWHVIARNVRFAGWSHSGFNDQRERYAGVQDALSYLLAAALLGVGYGLNYSVINGLAANEAPTGYTPQALLLFSLGYFIGVFGFPLLAGTLIVQGGPHALLLSVLCVALLNWLVSVGRLLGRWRARALPQGY